MKKSLSYHGSNAVVRKAEAAEASFVEDYLMFYEHPPVKQIWRVEAPELRKRFDDYVAEKHIKVIEYFFHGTTRQAALSIAENGFIPSRSGKFGPGVYTAQNLTLADCYSRGDNVILFCRAAFGHPYVVPYSHNFNATAEGIEKGFDCVQTTEHTFSDERTEVVFPYADGIYPVAMIEF